MADDLVDQLLAQTGLHLGTDRDPTNADRAPQIARIVVSALPGRSGVAFDYEGLPHNERRPLGHAEHAVLGRTSAGLALFSASIHTPVVVELAEAEPGYFVAADGASPFPMAVRIEVPSGGRLVYSWLFAEPGGELTVRNIGDVALVS